MFLATDTELYPESDGKPMAENTVHYEWITTIKENLEQLFADEPNVFVAADLFWYPVQLSSSESRKGKSLAPDVMVVFGVPKGDRGSYIQHLENDIAPQVVFEIHSPSNDADDRKARLQFYKKYGVEEYYYLYPEQNELEVWLRHGKTLEKIACGARWVSPRLQIRFEMDGETMRVCHPNGEPFESYAEQRDRIRQTTAQRDRERAEKERGRAEKERERQRADLAEAEKERERAEKERLAAKLRSLGIDPDEM